MENRPKSHLFLLCNETFDALKKGKGRLSTAPEHPGLKEKKKGPLKKKLGGK